jgi:ankyrin repeat protein
MKTALHYAVSENRYKTTNYLLNKSIDPNMQTKYKRETALHIACRRTNKKIIILLLNQNADPNLQDANGKTCLHVVADLNSREHIVAFINHCKYPINWDIEDNIGRKASDVPTSKEI